MTEREQLAREASEYSVEMVEDRPASGMWHCGPNAAWVTVTHLPTMISARAFDQSHHKARQAALACCEMMVEQSRLLKCQFPERLREPAEPTQDEARGAPVSDWSWWVGSDEYVSEEGIYDLYECGSREDAIAWAECHINPGEVFHIIEARWRALQDDDEHMPFAAQRNHEVLTIDEDGNAIAAMRGEGK